MFQKICAIGSYPRLSDHHRNFRQKLVLLFSIYGIIFLFNILNAPLLYLWEYVVIHLLHYKSPVSQYKITMHSLFAKYGYWKAVLYISLLGPFIEEMIFRLSLSFKRKHIAAAFGFALVLLARVIPGIRDQDLALGIPIRIVLFAAGYFAFVKVLPQNISPNKRAQTFIIVASIITFGLLHTLNYAPLQLGILFIYPLYVLPQLVMGWLLTYVRFRNGFFWGIALHIMINSVIIIIQSVYQHY
ncbi:CPBP family glutamic-type intramembrane protease [Mucilaginibacter phyllosphaerae]|uniref:CPBP family intramembrane metalloprotease n=1 Tax=Mucilaginibacter phyllosphaerae TaxID=1812349 RepID=A0A4Y8A6R4_9SPHI|nr:CPBP family glutamic-type intramembrane protease [Mucilaginibacter phyllosphaerae]MBB3970976.1 hypothetical protein [Mucilaginibacter phyllosphaerae]TEW64092.1 CPBP family intramembrane metalloprotease [Mucilaginibacter phyllosphaerae]GGH05833.1 hypothetical protein GCM10007352_09760 [Mucilaginibacter phyllosphaerae]